MRLRVLLAVLWALRLWSAAVPRPESHFGFKMGEDRKLIAWDKTVAYFRLLDQASDRILVRELGKTTEGRPFVAAWISAAENLKQLEQYGLIQKRLADPRKTSASDAEPLFTQGKSVVMITCSIHSSEVASTLTAVEFAHRLLTEDRPKFRAILSNVIFILVPSLNPDGVDIIERWYRKTLGTPHEGTSPPELYQKYVGHDNNRDWYIFSQAETRLAVSRLHNEWHPQIVYDVHQQGPYASRIFIPPWLDPIEPNVDPLSVQAANAFGAGMAMDLTAAGRKGVVINASYDLWTPARHYQSYHGGFRILSESASVRLATPIRVRPDQVEQNAKGYDPRQRSWNYLEPWLGGDWRLRDIVADQLITMESCLYQAAVRREDVLRNFYRIGVNAVSRTSPYAFVIPATQYDPGAARTLLQTLSFGLVEIERAAAPFSANGRQYPSGAYVIRMQQPYSSFAKALLERQNYPDLREYPGGPPKRPYDVTAHTLPLLMGVDVAAVNARFEASLEPARSFDFAPDRPVPAGAISASDVNSWKEVNRIWSAGAKVYRDRATGHFYRRPNGFPELNRPRLGLYRSWVPSMDEGWTRWLLEQFGFQYESVSNRDIQSGKLGAGFDALIFPDQSAESISRGYAAGSMPDEFTGGLGEKGVEALKSFGRGGGRLIFLNSSTDYAGSQLGVSLKNTNRGLPSRDFYCPGSLLNVTLDDKHPLALGLPRQIAVWSEHSPAWEIENGAAGRAVALYPPSGVLASGWLLGEQYLTSRAAILDLPFGQGRLILFGLRPQYRAQSYQTFKLLFNAIVGP